MITRLKLFFLPHPKNNYRAFLLQPSFLSLIIALYVLNQSILRTISIVKPGILGYSSEITVTKVLEFTNLERQQAGLEPLRLSSILSNSAIAKANNMFAQNYWSHNSPNGTTPWTFFREAGYQYSVAGENLAKDFYDTDSMVTAWMNSSTHRANILNTKYQEIGIAVVNGTLNGIQTTLVVQHFGTPIIAPLPTKTEVQANDEGVTPKTITNPSEGEILAKEQTPSVNPINPLSISKSISTILFAVIIIALVIDVYYTFRHRPYRLAGSSTGHISFLAIIFLLMLFTRQGSIF